MRKTILKAIALLAIPFAMVGLSSGDTYADVSTIPEGQSFTDINFYNCVVNKIGADNVAVTGPTTEQLESITSLTCSGYQKPEAEKIKDASGLEKMTALTYLNLSYNQLTSIDVSNNTALTSLRLYRNQLASIDLSHNTALTYLDLDSNQLSNIDVSKNTALEDFAVDDIFVKTAITSSDATGPKQYDLSTLKFFVSVIPEGDGYTYNGESKILTVQNPLSTNYIQVDNPQNYSYRKFKLVLYEESTPAPDDPTPTPGTDTEDEDIVVPDTGTITGTEGGALAIFAASTAVILAIIGLATHLKNRNKDHYIFDK